MQAAEGPQHAPDHLQGHAVEAGKLVEQQRVEGPEEHEERRTVAGEDSSTKAERWKLHRSSLVGVDHLLLLKAQAGFALYHFVVQQLVEPLFDQVPRAHQEVPESAQRLVDERPHALLLYGGTAAEI